MSESIVGPDTGGVKALTVSIPSLTDNADIQEAFKKFVYGTTSIPADVTSIDEDSLAGYLYDTRSVALNASAGALSVTLLGTTDLNTVIETGFSFQSSDSNATSGRNYPSFLVDAVETRYGGFLFTMSKNNSYIQEYSTVSSAADSSEALFASVRSFFRSGKILGAGSTAWSAWREVSDSTHNHDTSYYLKTEIDTKLSTKLELASSSPLLANSVLVTDANGEAVVATAIDTTELGYLNGVTSGIQTQINGKANSSHTHAYTDVLSNNTGANKLLVTSASNGAVTVVTAPSTSGTYLSYNGTNLTWAAPSGGGSGTVTSVGLSLPSMFTVSGSPVSTTGTLTGTLATQAAKTVLAGPASGSNAAPTFRALTVADLGIQKGISTSAAMGSGVSSTTGSVTFSPSFSVNPVMSIAPLSDVINGTTTARITSVSTSGFSYTVTRSITTQAGESVIVHWIAIPQ